MKKRQFVSLALTAMMAAGLFAGCGNGEIAGGAVKNEANFEITEDDGVSGDILSIKQPKRELDTKELNIYAWIDIDSMRSSEPEKNPNPVDILEKQHGVTVNVNTVAQTDYWKNLSTLIAAGTSPDIVLIPNWDFYPVGITGGCLQPLDDIINFDKPLWDGGKEAREKYKWTDGKTYFPFSNNGTIQKYIFFNKKIFADAGLKNPYEYYKEGNWTYETFKDLCSKTYKTEGGKVTQYAIYMQPNEFVASTGVEIVETDPENGYKFNLRDEKVAKCMNLLYELGNGGLKVLGGAPTDFRQQRMAMILTDYWTATSEFNKIRQAGNLGWVPMPAIDKNSSCYNSVSVSASYGLVKGAKNVNCAALFIELDAWKNLTVSESGIPTIESYDTPFYKAYPEAESLSKADTEKSFTDEEIAIMKEMGLKNVPGVSFMWKSWLQTDDIGQLQVTDYAKPWSQVLEEIYPVHEKTLKSYFED